MMSEMLANQYFLARRYQRALPLFRALLIHSLDAVHLQNKLLICYLQTEQFGAALVLCLEILRADPSALIGTDPDGERFPCQELADRQPPPHSTSELNQLALLYLYCRPALSLLPGAFSGTFTRATPAL